MAEYRIIGIPLQKRAPHAVTGKSIMSIGQNHIVAETGLEHANCVLDVAPGSVGVLAHIGGGKPEMLGHQIRGYRAFV
jgi:hypothetical protein